MTRSAPVAAAAFCAALAITPAGAHTQSCDCDAVLDHVAGYVERNYAGFRDKVTPAQRPGYDALRARLRSAAAAVADDAACHTVLNEYIAFFRDRHLNVSRAMQGVSQQQDDDAIRARFASWPARRVTEAEVRARIEAQPTLPDALDGIWEMAGANYRMAMVPSDTPGNWDAVILQADSVWWVPGQIKGRFRRMAPGIFEAETYLRDHRPVQQTAQLVNGVLALSDGVSWARTWPDNPSGYERARHDASANRAFAVRDLDPQTVLIQLPTFSGTQAERIDSLIHAHSSRLTSVPNLIIDVRGNGGGADRSFRALRPLLYTRPTVDTGQAIYATEENIAAMIAMIEQRGIPADQQAHADSIIAAARTRIGQFLVQPPDTFRLDGVLPLPLSVAVLTDRFCASSCEAFVLVALQSDKVTVYGQNTGGLLDYGLVTPVPTPCAAFTLNNPTSRSNHLSERSYDLVGIPPEVPIPPGVLYPLDWVHAQLTGRR